MWLINMIPAPYRLAAVAVLVALSAFGGYRVAKLAGERALADYKAHVAAAVAAQTSATLASEREAAKTTQETENAWFQNLDALHAHYAGRLRQQSAACGRAVPGIPEAACCTDAAAADDQSDPDAFAPAGCAEAERDAAVTTLQLLSLQDWIRKQARGE